MYYGLILLSVAIFGGCFGLDDIYQRRRGTGLRISLEYSLLSALAGLVVLAAINGFRVEITLFGLIMALLSALIGFGYTFCTFRALRTINLSLYSVFAMLGGMLLPSLQGIVVYGETLTVGKIMCFLLIGVALTLTVQRGSAGKGFIYYFGVFALNGMSGVLAKYYTAAPFEKGSAAGYSILICLCTAAIAAVLLFVLPHAKTKTSIPAGLGIGILSGVGNKLANYLLIIALLHVDASVQYPMVTGGVMIVSTLISYLGPKKPTRRDVVSVIFGFAGMLALFLIPI
jgi:drug/metabolite transporter (DMT)-like permease